MKRSEKEIKDSETIQKIFKEAEVCRIAISDGEKPYIVPMNFGYKANSLYFHSASEGHKIDILKKNNNVCFQMDIQTKMVKSESPCNWGMKYLSVVGSGKAQIIHNQEEKRRGLDILMAKYSSEESFQYSDEAISKVTVIKLEIDEVTG